MLIFLTSSFFTLLLPLTIVALPFRPCEVEDKFAAAFYTGWRATDVPLTSVSWSKYNTMIYAFALTTPDVGVLSLNASEPSLLPEFVKQAHVQGVSAHISVGGWSGSRYFSSHFQSAENRTAFANTILDFLNKYDLDGGIGCNVINPNDTANYLAFLQEFRSTSIWEKYHLLDFISIMDYDVNGSWSPAVGPNSPLDDSCTGTAYQFGSAATAVKAWRAAGFPLKKTVLAVPSYGHSYYVTPSDAFANNTKNLAPYPPFNTSKSPLGDGWDNATGIDACGATQPSGGTWNFRGLVAGGWLGDDGKPAQGIYYRYDNCSRTPYLYNENSQIMISYDDAVSYAAKGRFIEELGLYGFVMWEAGGDYDNILLSAIRSAGGFN
ncbi:glycoside hydrolase family 18 protein [Pisolithus marmoratus]|nr:glycoside hydrolase family 18 protein [Pisolithus marmoratus]